MGNIIDESYRMTACSLRCKRVHGAGRCGVPEWHWRPLPQHRGRLRVSLQAGLPEAQVMQRDTEEMLL